MQQMQAAAAAAAQQQPGQPGGSAIPGSGSEPLTTAMLAHAMPQEQKQMLGERIFPLIQRLYPDLAGKITGMLLEMDNSELLMMLENTELLKTKARDRTALLRLTGAID